MAERTALVTGGNRGIGLETCCQLGKLGLRVVLTARDAQQAQAVAADLVCDGLDVVAEQLDVSEAVSVEACAQCLYLAGTPVDVLVNNAGIYPTTPLLRISESELLHALAVNAVGAWRTCRTFIPGMRERGYGRVVNVATGYAHVG